MACSIRQNAPTGVMGMSFFIHFINSAASLCDASICLITFTMLVLTSGVHISLGNSVMMSASDGVSNC